MGNLGASMLVQMATIYWSWGGHQIQSPSIEFFPRKFRLGSETSQSLSRCLGLEVTCKIQDLWTTFAVMSLEEVEADGLNRRKHERSRDEMKLLITFLSLALASAALAFHEPPQSSFGINYFRFIFCSLQSESKKYSLINISNNQACALPG